MNNQGWICPKCGMVHNPNTAFCPCSMKVTCCNMNVSLQDIENAVKLTKVFEDFGHGNTQFSGV